MAHYAKVENGIVTKVIVADSDYFNSFVDDTPGEWIQTSYNTYGGKHYTEDENGIKSESADQTKALRKNYAGIGYTYDEDKDAFYGSKPYDSWLLDSDTCLWEAPVAKPNDGQLYQWNEEDQTWDLTE